MDRRGRREGPGHPAIAPRTTASAATLFPLGAWSSIGNPQHAIVEQPSRSPAHPAVTVVEISDPTAAGAGIELLDIDAVQLQPLPLRARRVIVRLGRSAIVSHSANRRVRTRTSARDGLLAYVTFGPHAVGSVDGLPVGTGSMVVVAPDATANFVVDAG
jgi:hypothetical protein